uniref:T9SS type A sorting domain-containing protein n=1 Tax=Mariniflexile sp. TaxID=1979402 RepID=UPI004048BE4E
MKTNYTLQTIKTGLVIFAMALSFTFASAQVVTVYEDAVLDPPADTVFPAGPIQLTSSEIAIEGVTFKIQVTATPGGNATFFQSNANMILGTGTGGINDNPNTFEGDEGESATINGLTVVDFNPGTTSYTVDAISDLHFHSINFRNAQHSTDQPLITVNGNGPNGPHNLGDLASNYQVTFGVEFTNNDIVNPPATFTVGDDSTVTEITLANGSTEANDVYNFSTLTASYTFTTAALSVDDIIKKDALAIYPTVVENTFSVNKAFETLKIFDLTGKAVKTFSASDVLEVSGLVSGLYIVKIQSEVGGIATGRLIVK